MKNPEERASASQLLKHDFIRQSKTPEVLLPIIEEAHEMRERLADNVAVSCVVLVYCILFHTYSIVIFVSVF